MLRLPLFLPARWRHKNPAEPAPAVQQPAPLAQPTHNTVPTPHAEHHAEHGRWHTMEQLILNRLAAETARTDPWTAALRLFADDAPPEDRG